MSGNISIGIGVQSAPNWLQATLASLLKHTTQTIEVLLLPDGANAMMTKALAQRFREWPQLATEQPQGIAAGFNRLAKATTSEVLVLLESGAIVGPNWLDYLLAALAAHPSHGLAGPSTNRAMNAQAVFSRSGCYTLTEVAQTAAQAAQHLGNSWRLLEPKHSLADFCYVVRREVVQTIGMADETYGLEPGWEIDYNLRAAQAGFLGVWACGAYVHRGPATITPSKPAQLWLKASIHRTQNGSLPVFPQHTSTCWRLDTPFDIVNCSWPRPVEKNENYWTSEPEWNTPRLPYLPPVTWKSIGGVPCWFINWHEFFGREQRYYGSQMAGEMRGFHVIFHLRINGSGTLIFWSEDGCLIRHNGELIHADRSAQGLTCHQILVNIGDHLEVAQWQSSGPWQWAGRLVPLAENDYTPMDLLWPYLKTVQQNLARPNGPPLKMYFSGQTPYRTVVSLYSMILNGYRPSEVLIFGDYQWPESSRHILTTLLPFAHIVPQKAVLAQLESLGSPQLMKWACQYWFVMKACVALLYPPETFCLMDDDIFILEPVADALEAFQHCQFVFSPDVDHSALYLKVWKSHSSKAALSINAGLYWLRNTYPPAELASALSQLSPTHLISRPWLWEQGFISVQYANETVYELPSQYYFCPLFDGLPGGLLGYDYTQNPSGFKSIHFAGEPKPSDTIALILAPEILGRQTA